MGKEARRVKKSRAILALRGPENASKPALLSSVSHENNPKFAALPGAVILVETPIRADEARSDASRRPIARTNALDGRFRTA
jgi:hypothetical protein